MTTIFTEKEAEDFLEKRGFPVVRRVLVKNKSQMKEAASKIGFPLVLKNPSILHKTEKNAVRLNVTKETLEREYSSLNAKEVLIQKQMRGLEFILGLKKDAVFGHVIACGLGGIFTEIFHDVSFRVCPLTEKDVHSMLSELRAHKLLEGARGTQFNRRALERIILRLSGLPQIHLEINELDINPVIIDAKQATIVDARIIFGKKLKTSKTVTY